MTSRVVKEVLKRVVVSSDVAVACTVLPKSSLDDVDEMLTAEAGERKLSTEKDFERVDSGATEIAEVKAVGAGEEDTVEVVVIVERGTVVTVERLVVVVVITEFGVET